MRALLHEGQAEFGRRFGVSRMTVIRWEKGKLLRIPAVLAELGYKVEIVKDLTR